MGWVRGGRVTSRFPDARENHSYRPRHAHLNHWLGSLARMLSGKARPCALRVHGNRPLHPRSASFWRCALQTQKSGVAQGTTPRYNSKCTSGAICSAKKKITGRNSLSAEDTEKPEKMAAFFDVRAAGYDDHMRDVVFESDARLTQFYEALSSPIAKTDEPLRILDLGCGTGLEIAALLHRVPNALITGVDVSEKMLELLQKRYIAHMNQITLVADSYLTIQFGAQAYDHVISAMTVHHLLRDTKLDLYTKIHAALKPGGKYIEGDSVIPPQMESQFLAEYHECVAGMPQARDGHYHIDVPFSIDSQRSLLLQAGFKDFELVWQKDSSAVWNAAVYAVTK
jgi:tRNA (cmo5U34)-methyltransferase